MSQEVPDKLPLWLRPVEWPLRVRVALLTAITSVYLAVFAAVPTEVAASMRPVNLFMVLVAGVFFGLPGGAGYGGALAVLNVTLYWVDGILDPTGATLSGNVLSVVFGVLAGVIVGRVRDLSLALRKEVRRRLEAERRRDELTAHLIHDLKNPLSGIVGYAQLLLEDHLAGPQLEALQHIQYASERMNRMVMMLLDIARAEDGQLKPAYQPVELPRLLEEVQTAMHPFLAQKQQTLSVIQTSENGRIEADPDLLRRVLLNLVENASKYTPQRREVRLEVGGSGDSVEVTVRDQGPGIPAGYEERIFEKYARLEREAGAVSEVSRGLGLHFCRLATQAHGGRIWVEKNDPAGSAFRMRLPRGRVTVS